MISITFCAFARFAILLLTFVLELAEVKQATDRWHGVRRHLYQIHTALLCESQGLESRQYAELVAFFIDARTSRTAGSSR